MAGAALLRVTVSDGEGSFELSDEVLAPYREALKKTPRAAPRRLVYAAAHLVMNSSYGELGTQATPPEELAKFIDWEATCALRVRLDRLGFGIAEAMDTAQRFSIGWHNAHELLLRCGALGLARPFIAGAGVDHLDEVADEAALIEGVVYQARTIQAAGGWPILLPMLPLARWGADEACYLRVYEGVIAQLEGPLFVHWLGEMFLAELAGYFPGHSFERVMAIDPAKLRGAKLSLLDPQLERRLRSELLIRDQILFTGDDLNFADLIAGPDPVRSTLIADSKVQLGDFSHALLGIFDAIAEPASLALEFLARGDEARYRALIEPCQTLSRHLFSAPTEDYKAGLAWLSWLNGNQKNPMLVERAEGRRDLNHIQKAARLASLAGAVSDAGLCAERLGSLNHS